MMPTTRSICILFTLILFFSLPPTGYGSDEPLELRMEAYLVTTVIVEDKKVEKLLPVPEEVEPGSVIQYSIKGRNTLKKNLNKVSVVGAIPGGTRYIEQSETSTTGAETLFSIDAGRSYEKPPIMEKAVGPDGAEVLREVEPDRYTNIKFVIERLKGEEEFVSSYRVKVK